MGCATGTIRYLIFFVNFVLALAGLGVLILGVMTADGADGPSKLKDLLHGQLSTPATTLAVVGGCIFLFAFFGCCGALRENRCMIITYAVLLLTLFIMLVVVAVVAYSAKSEAPRAISDIMKDFYQEYKSSNDTKAWIDKAQQELKCCGSTDNNTPWGAENRPPSCLSQETKQPFTEGCTPKIVDLAMGQLATVAHVALAIGVILVVGIILTLYLATSIRRAETRGYA